MNRESVEEIKRACKVDKCWNICVVSTMLMNFWLCAGEFHGRRDPWDDGQEEEHQEHVGHCPRRPRQVDADRLTGIEGRNHRRGPCR